ncbi:MAG: hypothetical protein U0939_16055 [Pirellulales bacterium]
MCVAIALTTPWVAAASEPFRQARQGLIPPAVLIQITNAAPAEVPTVPGWQFTLR